MFAEMNETECRDARATVSGMPVSQSEPRGAQPNADRPIFRLLHHFHHILL
jgi:hypothetical protein